MLLPAQGLQTIGAHKGSDQRALSFGKSDPSKRFWKNLFFLEGIILKVVKMLNLDPPKIFRHIKIPPSPKKHMSKKERKFGKNMDLYPPLPPPLFCKTLALFCPT